MKKSMSYDAPMSKKPMPVKMPKTKPKAKKK